MNILEKRIQILEQQREQLRIDLMEIPLKEAEANSKKYLILEEAIEWLDLVIENLEELI